MASDHGVAAVLRDELARRRRAGEPFATAWGPARQAALDSATGWREDSNWRAAFAATVDAWQAAYTGATPDGGEACSRLERVAT